MKEDSGTIHVLMADDDPDDRMLMKEAIELNKLNDLNMPRVDGREALKLIKSDPALRRIPVIVLTTSKADEDIRRTYDMGVNSYISKPANFSDLVKAVRQIGHYWFRTVELPKT